MNLAPSSLASRALAVGLLLIAVGVLWHAAVQPTWDAFVERREELSRSHRLLEEYGKRSVSRGDLQIKLEELKRRPVGHVSYLEAVNLAMASATLQATVKRVTESNGGFLRSVQVLPSASEGTLQRVAVRIDGNVQSGHILDLLYELRTTTPNLFVDNIDIRVPDTLANAASTRPHPDFTIRAEIHAYLNRPTK